MAFGKKPVRLGTQLAFRGVRRKSRIFADWEILATGDQQPMVQDRTFINPASKTLHTALDLGS